MKYTRNPWLHDVKGSRYTFEYFWSKNCATLLSSWSSRRFLNLFSLPCRWTISWGSWTSVVGRITSLTSPMHEPCWCEHGYCRREYPCSHQYGSCNTCTWCVRILSTYLSFRPRVVLKKACERGSRRHNFVRFFPIFIARNLFSLSHRLCGISFIHVFVSLAH